ncbi:MAG: hypothetical protein WBA73_10975 [Devosia sp.]
MRPLTILLAPLTALSMIWCAVAQDVNPVSTYHRFIEASENTFRMEGAVAKGNAASLAMQVLNYFGLNNQISTWMDENRSMIKDLLDRSQMPGVLIYVQQQKSMTDVSITTLVGDRPRLIGPALSQVEGWKAYVSTDQIAPKVTDGYQLDDANSFFLWAKLKDGDVEYGLTIPATLIINEALRDLSDSKLRIAFASTYQQEVLDYLLKRAESNIGLDASLRRRATDLLNQRRQALNDLQQINADLEVAVDKARHANQVASVFETLATVLTVANLSAELAAEFPDDAAKFENATSMDEVRSAFSQLVERAATEKDAIAIKLTERTDFSAGLKIQTIQVVTEMGAEVTIIPGAP